MKKQNSIAVSFFFAIILLSLEAFAQGNKPRIAFVSGLSAAFHVPELQGGAAMVKDSIMVAFYGVKSKDLTTIDSLDPRLFDLIIIEKSEVELGDWQKRNKEALRGKKVYVNTVLTFDGTVKAQQYPEMDLYFKSAGTENAKGLFQYIGNKFFNLSYALGPVIERPRMAFYHPDAPSIFTTLAQYESWYKGKRTYRADSLNIGIIFSSFSYIEKNIVPIDSLIRSIEKRGHNAYALMRSGNGFIDTLLQQDGITRVDAVIMVLSNFRFVDYEAGIKQLQKINVPLLSAFNHYGYTPEQWEKSSDGLLLSMGGQLTPMFKDGIFEPMVISGSYKNEVGKNNYVPIMYQLNWRVDRAIAWAKLHRMKNADKRMMITFYSEDGGKANVGSHPAHYFNAPASILKLLEGMKARGWNVGDKPLPDAQELTRLLAGETSNVGNWAQGEIDRRVKNGHVVMIPESQYLQWFRELPLHKQQQLTESWGPPPGKVMVHTDSRGEKFILIPKLEFGNVLLAPNPDWGYLQNSSMLYSNTVMPPSHQYFAFYCWFQKVYQPHVRFSIFNNLEVMEHKFAGPSKKDWLGIMTGNYPNIHISPLMTGLAGKEIMSDLPISYLNAIVPSGLNPNLTELRLKIKQLNDHVVPELKQELANGIFAETKRLKLDGQLHLNTDTLSLSNLLTALQKYFVEVDGANMPSGTHTLGDVPEGETRVAMVRAMLGPEFETMVAPLTGSLDQNKKIDALLCAVLLEGMDISQAQKLYLPAAQPAVTAQLQLALEYQRRLLASKDELAQYLNAFEGKYITPGSTDDPVRNPDAVPTGKNPYSFDAETAPTQEAWAIAVRMGDELIKQYKEKNKAYPRKIGFVLWTSEIIKNHGVLEAQILYLMGAKPVWDSKRKVVGVELIPKSELQRPRIDVVATTSGDYRDVYQDKAQLIGQAVRLVAALDEADNIVRKNTLAYLQQLKKAGKTDADAARISTIRVFSPALGTYSTSLQNVTKANDTWKSDTALSDLYINRMGHLFGKETMGDYERDYFVNNLKSVDAAAFSRSSNVYGLLDATSEPVAFFGGLQMAVRNSSGGRNIDMYMNDLRNNGGVKMETLEDFYHKEMQSRAFNPKWIEAMMKDQYSGAHYMQNITENLWAFQVTSPNIVKNADWNEMNEVFVKDKFGLGLNEFFEKANPYAKQTILSTMLGAAEKGYWKADSKTLAQLSTALAQSVAKNGAGCSSVICNTKTVQAFAVANLQAIPGGELLADNYRKGILQQTGAPSFAAPANVSLPSVPAPIKSSLAGGNKPARSTTAKPPVTNAPSGNTVQGNEIVTTSIQKLYEPAVTRASGKQKREMAIAGLVLLLALGMGWIAQGRKSEVT